MTDIFKSGQLLGGGLAGFAMGAKVPMVEAVKLPTTSEELQQMLESARAKPPEAAPPKEMTFELANQMLLEAAQTAAASSLLENAADAVFSWADGDDKSFDALDGYALALAGIPEDATDDEITDAQDDLYNDVWGDFADFMIAAGLDSDLVSSLCDDGDDDAASTIADSLSGLGDDDRSALIFAYSSSANSAMTEAVKKVVRHGEVVLLRKRARPRRLTSAQRAALKKARMKAHTASANLSRMKSLKLRAKRIG